MENQVMRKVLLFGSIVLLAVVISAAAIGGLLALQPKPQYRWRSLLTVSTTSNFTHGYQAQIEGTLTLCPITTSSPDSSLATPTNQTKPDHYAYYGGYLPPCLIMSFPTGERDLSAYFQPSDFANMTITSGQYSDQVILHIPADSLNHGFFTWTYRTTHFQLAFVFWLIRAN
jgi:hypothetical protein